MNFELIRRNFEKGSWDVGMVKTALDKGIITQEQFEELVGEKSNNNNDSEDEK